MAHAEGDEAAAVAAAASTGGLCLSVSGPAPEHHPLGTDHAVDDGPADTGDDVAEGSGGDSDAEPGDVFLGRPDLAQDAIEELRSKHRALKQEQKRVKTQLRNQARKRARILKKMRHLDTASVLQVLMDRGLDFASHSAASASSAPASSPRRVKAASGSNPVSAGSER